MRNKTTDIHKAVKFIKDILIRLNDDLQHYTMVDKDMGKVFFIKKEIEEYENIINCLDVNLGDTKCQK